MLHGDVTDLVYVSEEGRALERWKRGQSISSLFGELWPSLGRLALWLEQSATVLRPQMFAVPYP